jgi:hypothetical protein
MTSMPRRRFTIADAMILMAATAAGLALIRSKGMDFSQPPTNGALRIVNLVFTANRATFPFLMTWTPALLILGLMSPRPVWRRLFRQPGMAACSAATLVMAIELIPFVLYAMTLGVETAISKGFLVRMNQLVVTYAQNVPFSIEGAWATLVLSGLWRCERTWIDRVGTILGIVWIAGQIVEQGCYLFVALILR